MVEEVDGLEDEADEGATDIVVGADGVGKLTTSSESPVDRALRD